MKHRLTNCASRGKPKELGAPTLEFGYANYSLASGANVIIGFVPRTSTSWCAFQRLMSDSSYVVAAGFERDVFAPDFPFQWIGSFHTQAKAQQFPPMQRVEAVSYLFDYTSVITTRHL
jgi:hypothetical protein